MRQVQIDNNNWLINLIPSEFNNNLENSIIEVTDEIFNKLANGVEGYQWRYNPLINNFSLDPYDLEYLQKIHLEDLRFSRKSLLQAFDIYKINVFYGIDSDANHQAILAWYQAILDLDEGAINNPPQEVRKYL